MASSVDELTRPESSQEARRIISQIRKRERQHWEEIPEATRDELRGLRDVTSETLDNPSHVFPELLQNADDIGGACSEVTIRLTDDELVFRNHKEPMAAENVEALGAFTKSTKQGDFDVIGHFGIGFKTVFSLTDAPIIHSGFFSFRYSAENPTIPFPVAYEDQPATDGAHFDGTTVVIPFTEAAKSNRRSILEEQIENIDSLLPFLNNIETVQVKTADQTITYRRVPIDDGGFKIIQEQDGEKTLSKRVRLFSDSFTPDEALLGELAEKRHLDASMLQEQDPELEVTVAVPIDEAGTPAPKDESHLFCYFPTEPDTKLPFDIQADFSLKPDRKTIAWPDEFNKQLLQRVPAVFQNAFVQFHSEQASPSRILELVPDPTRERPESIAPVVEEIITFVRSESCVPDHAENLFQPSEVSFLDRPFRDLLSEAELSDLLDREARYPSPKITETARSRLEAIVPNAVVDVERLLDVSSEKAVFESRSVPWLVRFMAGVSEYWNAEYGSRTTFGLDQEEKEARSVFLDRVKAVPFLLLESGSVTSYSAVDGEVFRLREGYADDYQLFTGVEQLDLLAEELLSVVDDPVEELREEASLARDLLFADPLFGIEKLKAKDVVQKVINPAFEADAIDPDRADQFVLFVSKRPSSLATVTDIKLQSAGNTGLETEFHDPESLFFGGEYIDAYDTEAVFEPFAALSPISDHYLELDDRSREEWIDALAEFGVRHRIEVRDQDPWECDRFTTEERAREFLARYGGSAETDIHDEQVLDGYNGTKGDWQWMRRGERHGAVRNYKYGFIDRSLPEESRSVLESLTGEGDSIAYWKAFLRMLDAEWEEYYKDKMYRVYKYSQKKRKYRVKEGECQCLSSFGNFLKDSTWCPGSDDGLHHPYELFVETDRTRGKPVTFVTPDRTHKNSFPRWTFNNIRGFRSRSILLNSSSRSIVALWRKLISLRKG